MNKTIKDTTKAWDDRVLGAAADCVGVADESHEVALNEALELGGVRGQAQSLKDLQNVSPNAACKAA